MGIRYLRILLLAVGMLFFSTASFAQVEISVAVAPPELPVYEQPVCPGDGYIWTPGYWAWDGDDYYWVPGTWVEAPEVGYLWTPPYWGWGGSAFIFHGGYWGPTVGFYGGIYYGFGYFGNGFEGGRWQSGHFYYNRAVTNVNVTVIHNVYETRVNETHITRVSYNGGRGGIDRRPTREEEAAERERHIPPVAAQSQHIEAARNNRELRASANHGKPPIAATPKPGAFNEHETTKGGEAGARTDTSTRASTHAKDLPPVERHPVTNTGNPKVDQKYQKQQQQLSTKQDQDRQKLQQKQDKEHQQLAKQKASDTRTQQVEQKHQQQSQQLQQKHTQQQQHLEQHQQPAHQAPPPKEKH
jgi:hypothetical protein